MCRESGVENNTIIRTCDFGISCDEFTMALAGSTGVSLQYGENGGWEPSVGVLSCGEVLLTVLTSLRQEKDRNHENRVGEAPQGWPPQPCLSLFPSMLGLEVSLNLEVSGTFILLNTTLVPASLSFSWFHFRPWGHSPFRTLSPATHLLSYTHESHSVRAASRGKRATGSPSWDTRGPG